MAHRPQYSDLFTLRLWMEELGDNQTEWRGQVQHVPSGEVRYFREWSSLQAFLLTKLNESDNDGRPD